MQVVFALFCTKECIPPGFWLRGFNFFSFFLFVFFLLFLILTYSLLITFSKIADDYVLSIDPVYYVSFISRQQHQPDLPPLPSLNPLAFMFVLSKCKSTTFTCMLRRLFCWFIKLLSRHSFNLGCSKIWKDDQKTLDYDKCDYRLVRRAQAASILLCSVYVWLCHMWKRYSCHLKWV